MAVVGVDAACRPGSTKVALRMLRVGMRASLAAEVLRCA